MGTGAGTSPLHARRRRMLAVTCAGSFLGPVDITGVAVALPAMGRDLDLSFAAGIWVSAAYLLTYTVALVPVGRTADQWGRLRMWRLGVAVFATSSLLLAMAPDSTVLLALRGIQGVGAAILASMATALVSAVFPPGERGGAIGVNVTAIYLGLATGPLIGGLLVDGLGWRWVFLVNLPVAAAALVASRGLHDPTAGGGRPRVDVLGALLLGAGLACAMVPLAFAPLWGWTAPATLGLMALGAAGLAACLVRQTRAHDPLLDLALFRRSRLFAAASAAALLNDTAMFGAIALTAILLQVVGGRSPIAAGALLIVQPAFMVALSPVAGRMSDRVGSRWLSSGGMALIAVGLAGLATVPRDIPPAHLIPSLVCVGVGMAGFSSPNTTAAMSSVPPASLGVAAAVLATMRSLGQSSSVAVLGAIAASGLGERGGRVILGEDASALDALRFLDGYHAAMAVGAVVAAVGAAVSLTRG
ncbi:MAG: MFS transporter [Thermoleophilia bacterium]|nr:MFS transporter [Thermoleophilia bacterium]